MVFPKLYFIAWIYESSKRPNNCIRVAFLSASKFLYSRRSYFVGDTVKLEDVSGKLENGVLTISIKKRSEKEIEKEHLVQIA